jgi:hypothetical protein
MLACYFAVYVSMQKNKQKVTAISNSLFGAYIDFWPGDRISWDRNFDQEIESFKSIIFDFRSHVRTCGYKTFQEIESLNNALRTFDLLKNVKKIDLVKFDLMTPSHKYY